MDFHRGESPGERREANGISVCLRPAAKPGLWIAAFICLAAGVVLVETIAESSVAAPGFVLAIFAAGMPPAAQLAMGFASIFGADFLALPLQDKLIALILAGIVALPALGSAKFVYVSVEELRIQLSCSGAACAQGGIAAMTYLPMAWAGGFLSSEISRRFGRWHWWPSPLKPNFGTLFE